MRKKSYMNKSNLINEGILDKIFDFIKKGKLSKLQKVFRKHPEIQKRISQINKDSKEIDLIRDTSIDLPETGNEDRAI